MAVQTIQINITPEELELLLQKSVQVELEKVISKIAPQSNEKEFFTRQQAIDFLGISYVCLHDWTNKGIISAYKLGNRTYYKYSELVEKIMKKSD